MWIFLPFYFLNNPSLSYIDYNNMNSGKNWKKINSVKCDSQIIILEINRSVEGLVSEKHLKLSQKEQGKKKQKFKIGAGKFYN